MNVLSIGNSFSADAQHYLHRIAKHNGVNLRTVNLFIGGCSLQTHYLNMLDDREDYGYMFNGEFTGLKVSIREALRSDSWSYITLQQVSNKSPKYESFSPYLEELTAYVRKYCPHTRILMHETWAYEEGCERLTQAMGYATAADMLSSIRDSYKKAADLIGAHGIIPCGEAMLAAEKAGLSMHRDGSHASFGAGRYLLGLTWLKTLTGMDVSADTYNEFDVPVTDEERAIITRVANEVTI